LAWVTAPDLTATGAEAGRLIEVSRSFVRLRWRLLRGAIRHGGGEQVGALLSTVTSIVIGLGVGTAAAVIGRTNPDAADHVIVLCTVMVIAMLGFGIVVGIAQPIDPRVLGAEPLGDTERAAGLLAASALGPPGLAGAAIGIGIVVGMVRGPASLPVVAFAVAAWLVTLLLLARTATNALALLVTRSPRVGQLVVGASGIVFYGAFQFVPFMIGRLDDDRRHALVNMLKWTPPGQLGEAIGVAAADPLRAMLHLLLGAAWLPLLAKEFLRSAGRLTAATRQRGSQSVANMQASPIGRLVRQLCGTGPAGAIAWRSILTRFRTPRTLLEAFTGAGVGLAAVLVPALTRDTAGSGAVLVGGAVQLAVLFMSGNSFGSDGPAITHELLAGAKPRHLVVGKARSIGIVAAPLAVLGPLLAASITGEWRYLVAGIGVGLGSLLAGCGAAVVQSTLVPIAMPESDNPFASGESGKGMLAGLLLCVVLFGLAVATVPVALGLLWATDTGNAALVTLLGAFTVCFGWMVAWLGVTIATFRLRLREPEFVASITPAR
jgi:hypothetical protein